MERFVKIIDNFKVKPIIEKRSTLDTLLVKKYFWTVFNWKMSR